MSTASIPWTVQSWITRSVVRMLVTVVSQTATLSIASQVLSEVHDTVDVHLSTTRLIRNLGRGQDGDERTRRLKIKL
ncbi:hypothetical protein BDY19DRAFT_979851 [Irpex rosettiformis]|uniref:Uncharacterized protein n=1 Tax=Irpex rosettiformis TaxID=378272 RepID=A0ACB8TMN6_9APHY|nr:hypothetical protein BDY19DRAFT_979851 [Irpex rosettiformis]